MIVSKVVLNHISNMVAPVRVAYFSESFFRELARRYPQNQIAIHLGCNGYFIPALEYEGPYAVMKSPELRKSLPAAAGKVGDFVIQKHGLLGLTTIETLAEKSAATSVMQYLQVYSDMAMNDKMTNVVQMLTNDLKLTM